MFRQKHPVFYVFDWGSNGSKDEGNHCKGGIGGISGTGGEFENVATIIVTVPISDGIYVEDIIKDQQNTDELQISFWCIQLLRRMEELFLILEKQYLFCWRYLRWSSQWEKCCWPIFQGSPWSQIIINDKNYHKIWISSSPKRERSCTKFTWPNIQHPMLVVLDVLLNE